MKFAITISLTLLASLLSTAHGQAPRNPTDCLTYFGSGRGNNGPHCWVCHGTGAPSNPYTTNCVSADSLDKNNGHNEAKHNDYDPTSPGGNKRDDHIWCPTGQGISAVRRITLGLPADLKFTEDGTIYSLDTCESEGTVPRDPQDDPPGPKNNPAGGGDPHFKTWAGEWYDFHGMCDLVFLSAPDFGNGLGMDIHFRTKTRYEYSYIETAALRIGDDFLEFGAWGNYFLNGIMSAGMPNKLAGYKVTYEVSSELAHKAVVHISEEEKVEMKAFKDMVSVKLVKPAAANFESSVGMLGTYHEGIKLGRDGQTFIEDVNAFGQEWQVTSEEPNLFMTSRFPQYPQQCILPKPKAQESRRLGESIFEATARKACQHWGDAIEQCVYDVMATGDLELADAGAY